MLRCKYHFVEQTSGVGVLDKALLVLDAVAGGATSLAALTEDNELTIALKSLGGLMVVAGPKLGPEGPSKTLALEV